MNNELTFKYFNNTDILNTFLTEVRKYKVPTIEEEEEIIDRYIKFNDEEARNELIFRNLRFIYSLAKIYAKNEGEVLDYVNEGVIGMIIALEKFESNKGFRFITYAVWYVKREMNNHLTRVNPIIIKSNYAKVGKKVSKIKNKFKNEFGYLPTNDFIKEQLEKEYNIKIKNDSDLQELEIYSLNSEYNKGKHGDDVTTLEDEPEFSLLTAHYNDYENKEEKDYAKETINSFLKLLSKKNREIIKMFYGIGYERAYALEEISDIYCMNENVIQKLIDSSILYMRNNIKNVI